MFLRSCAIALTALVLSAGFGSAHADHNKQLRYPRGAFGYEAYVETQGNHHHRAASGVACDRSRNICYDRYGISYHATARYLGERQANRAYKHYGDQVFLFTPTRGIICDRRTDSCSKLRWGHYGYGNSTYQPWPGQGANQYGWQAPHEQEPYWPRWSNDRNGR